MIKPEDKAAVWSAIDRNLPRVTEFVRSAAARLRQDGFPVTQRNLSRGTLFLMCIDHELHKTRNQA